MTITYGYLRDYATGAEIRPASRRDWRLALKLGDKHTGAHRTEEFADRTVFCDAEDDPAPFYPRIEAIARGAYASLLDGAGIDDTFCAAHDELFNRYKAATWGGDESDQRAWGEACQLANRVESICARHGSVRDYLDVLEAEDQRDADEQRASFWRDIRELGLLLAARGQIDRPLIA